MNKNLNQHVKSDKAKWAITSVVIVLILLTVVGMCLQLFGQGKVKPSEWFKKQNKPVTETNSSLEIEVENSPQLLLSQSETVAVSSETSRYLEATLTATVLPEEATNKNVTWAVRWWSETNETDISEYWQIIPTNQVNVVKIRLLQNATRAKITVTTEDGGHTASADAYFNQSVDYMTVSPLTYEHRYLNSENASVIDRGKFTDLGNSTYEVHLFRSDGSIMTNGKYDNQCMYVLALYCFDFFGNRIDLGNKYSDGFKEIKLDYSLNQPIEDVVRVGVNKDWSNSDYYHLSLQFYQAQYNTSPFVAESMNFSVTNSTTGKALLNFTINFIIPVASVTLDQTEIVF